MQPGRMRGGRRLLIVLGGKLRVGKIGNRESNGVLDYDGFCWMGGRNNQPKVGRNDGISFGEDGAQGDDDWGGRYRIVCAIRFRGKNKYNEIRPGYRLPPIDDCTQQPTKLTRARWAEDISAMDWSMAVLKGFISFCKSAEKYLII
jgi:hypothetical protein